MIAFLLALIIPLGTFGNVYDIRETDALLEIESRAGQLDKEKIRSELEHKYRTHRPKDMHALPPAQKSVTYMVDVAHTLEYDIPRVDGQGKITGTLYPKGYAFNPLAYLPADPPPMVIFSGLSQKERRYVKKMFAEKPVMLVMTDGDWAEVSEQMGRQVYYLKKIMVDKFRLTHTVSVVAKSGTRLRVDVHAVN